VRSDLFDLSGLDTELASVDACFFCLGVSSVGMTEAEYRRITFELTTVTAQRLAGLNPGLIFVYVSGAGTDSSERGRSMWARIKGQTENALLRLPIRAAYMFRPGVIVPLHGIRSKTPVYRWLYIALTLFLPFLQRTFPTHVTTTERLGRAMLQVARVGTTKRVLETSDINLLGEWRAVSGSAGFASGPERPDTPLRLV